jgi:hypothetical protein
MAKQLQMLTKTPPRTVSSTSRTQARSSPGSGQAKSFLAGPVSRGHDFSRLPVFSTEGPTAAISGSGTATVSFKYAPEAKDKSSKIVFVQVMETLLDGKGVKPSTFGPTFNYRDADTTATFHSVDYLNGEKDPYYNGDDPQDGGTQGNATSTPKVDATMNDTANIPDGAFPAGSSKATWNFRTAALSGAGADAGTFYQYIDWVYQKEKGKTGKATVGGTGTGSPGKGVTDALDLWNKNHGFTMPTPPAPAPAPAPTPAPAPAPGPKPGP